MGIVGLVRPAIGGDALHPFMDPANDGDGRLGRRGRAVGGHADETAGSVQTTPRIRPIVRVLGHAGHSQGMHCLQQQRPQTPHQPAPVGVDLPGH